MLLVERYKKLIEETYTEPQNEEILGSYLNTEGGHERAAPEMRRKRKTVEKKKEVKTKDIRHFFTPVVAGQVPKNRRLERSSIITIED